MEIGKSIEIPFGAKDSELKGWEYTIPEGMEAVIKDGKIIVREKESEDERVRKWLIGYFNQYIIDEMPQVFGNGLNVKDILSWLEKQGSQNLAKTCKDEPKFKVGDWVVQENVGVYKIIEICESWYEVINLDDIHLSFSFDMEYTCHL